MIGVAAGAASPIGTRRGARRRRAPRRHRRAHGTGRAADRRRPARRCRRSRSARPRDRCARRRACGRRRARSPRARPRACRSRRRCRRGAAAPVPCGARPQRAPGMLDQVTRPAERRNHRAEAYGGGARAERVVEPARRVGRIGRALGEQQHLDAERADHGVEPRLAGAAGQIVRWFRRPRPRCRRCGRAPDSCRSARHGRQAGAARDLDQALGQRAGVVARAMEGAAAELDVHRQAVEAGGELLRQDRGR